ncbi:MAG: alpha/beta hydrolase [Bacteroidetes bacterium]|nr:alpha/beta hydrolase [Bacteroidota bacterium]
MKVYFISGMGADSRVFKHIHLPGGFTIKHLEWIPFRKNDSLEAYSLRLAAAIKPGEKFALLGLSMGGMMAAEITKQFCAAGNCPVVTILISSVPAHSHLPSYFRLSKYLPLHKLIPVRFLKSASILNRLFTSDNEADRKVLYQVINESDPMFIKWAMGAVLHWKNDSIPARLVQIHGTKDKVLPLRFTKPTHIIKNGNHMMIMNRAKELNALIAAALLQAQQEMIQSDS